MPENSFDARAQLQVGHRRFEIFRLDALGSRFEVARLPFSLKVRSRTCCAPRATAPSRPRTSRRWPAGPQLSIYDAATRYRDEGVPLIVLGGKEYGSGSSRDWAAKGTRLLGVHAVLAESFERIHRSNLVGMGVLPLQFADGESVESLALTGEEEYSISGIADKLNAGELPREATVHAGEREFTVRVRIDTPKEAEYFRHTGPSSTCSDSSSPPPRSWTRPAAEWVAARGEIGADTHRRDVARGGRCWCTRYPKEADMPNGIFPVPHLYSYPSRAAGSQPGFALRLRTRWRRRRLDEALAHGADPATSAELTLRAAQLRSPALRSQLANSLVKSLDDARAPERLTIKLQPHRAEIRDSADELLALVLRLQDNQPVDVRGAAMTALLLTEGASPLDADSGRDLRHAVRSARLALDAAASTAQALSDAA